MLLAIDIGNTNIVIGLFKEDKIETDWRLDSLSRRTEDEWGVFIQNLFSNYGVALSEVSGVVLSSVVPNLTLIFQKLTKKFFKLNAFVIDHTCDTGMEILYNDPAQVGADRICNAVAGYKEFGGPLVIIDFGTATTYDVVSSDGKYLGGIITPGLETSAHQLHIKTAKLPEVDLVFPDKIIAKDTENSMRVGIMYGAISQVEGLLNLIEKELKEKVKVISTGGIGNIIKEKTNLISCHLPNLTLDGMNLIYKKQITK